MVPTDQDTFQNQGLLLKIQDLTNVLRHTINLEETKIVINHNQNQELHSLQRLLSITVLDVTVDSATR